jgi:hypothetical protein
MFIEICPMNNIDAPDTDEKEDFNENFQKDEAKDVDIMITGALYNIDEPLYSMLRLLTLVRSVYSFIEDTEILTVHLMWHRATLESRAVMMIE